MPQDSVVCVAPGNTATHSILYACYCNSINNRIMQLSELTQVPMFIAFDCYTKRSLAWLNELSQINPDRQNPCPISCCKNKQRTCGTFKKLLSQQKPSLAWIEPHRQNTYISGCRFKHSTSQRSQQFAHSFGGFGPTTCEPKWLSFCT